MGTFLQSTATNVHLNSPTDCYCYSCVNLKCCGCSLTHQMYTVGITANWAPFLLTAGVGGGVAILMPGLASICASPPDTILEGYHCCILGLVLPKRIIIGLNTVNTFLLYQNKCLLQPGLSPAFTQRCGNRFCPAG